MADKQHSTINHRDWLHRLESLGLLAGATESGEESHLIRLFHDLIERAPTPALLDGLTLPDARRMEAMLGAGALDAAALAFLAEDTGYCFSRGGDGAHLASILLPRSADDATASGASLASACLAALALALADSAPELHQRVRVTNESSTLLH